MTNSEVGLTLQQMNQLNESNSPIVTTKNSGQCIKKNKNKNIWRHWKEKNRIQLLEKKKAHNFINLLKDKAFGFILFFNFIDF